MIVDNVKLYNQTPEGFRFAEPDIAASYEFDFKKDWILNPNNSAGITISGDNVITITKVKPSEWFIKSKYGFTDSTARNNKFYNKDFVIRGLAANQSAGMFTDVGCGYWSFNYKAHGLMIAPIDSSGLLLSMSYPWDMNVTSGYFKNPNWGAIYYGYLVDGNLNLYNWNGIGYNNYPEVGLCIYTSVDKDDEGYVTFPTPITIGCLGGQSTIDPTTTEVWEMSLGDETVYKKERNFQNLLINHGLGFHYKGNYGEEIQNGIPETDKENAEPDDVYVISSKNYPGSIYKNTGIKISIPTPTDLTDMLDRGMPVKFFATQTDASKETGLWYNAIKYFKENDIRTNFGAKLLFAKSDVNGSDYTDGDGWVDIRINNSNAVIDGCFDHCGEGRTKGVERVRFIVNGGAILKAKEVFRLNKYHLKEVEFINNVDPSKHVCPNMLSGMFNYCGLPTFPKGLGFSNTENLGDHSSSTCFIGYVAQGSAFETFGNLKPDGTQYELIVNPACMFAFDTRYAPNDNGANKLKHINCILDMKLVDPYKNSEMVFQCTNLQKCKIKNINKGIWSLDGVNHAGVINGDLPNIDEDSTNYLLSNVFDLRLNERTDLSGDEYTEGLTHSSLYLPATLKERASQAALRIATERGWFVYFGGELAEVGGGLPDGSTANTLDIVFANKETENLKIVKNSEWSIDEYPADTWEPVGIVVIPGNHGVLKDGTGTKNQCGVMSIVPMSYNTPETGGDVDGKYTYWGGYGTDIEGQSDGLGRYDSVEDGLKNYNGNVLCPKDSNIAYQMSGSMDYGNIPYQRTAGNTPSKSSPYAPSPYMGEDLMSGDYNESYGTTEFDTEGNFNGLADFSGIINTKIITDLAVSQEDWKTSETIELKTAAGYYPAACCCARFHTLGTKAFVDCTNDELFEGAGFWYFPALGELGYVPPKAADINEIISILNNAYGVGVKIINSSTSADYIVSTEYDKADARSINFYNGRVGRNNRKSTKYFIRAFMRL